MFFLAGFIPEEKLSEIKNASNLVDIVSEVVLLKRAGKDYWGLCPFHSEKTPSFKVDPEKQIFFCFGCRTGGNVFTFVMKQENISFAEAVKTLAGRCGIEIPERELSKAQQRKMGEKQTLVETNRFGMDFFRSMLAHHSHGKNAREYLAKRQMREKTINEFHIGYAPEGWDHLVGYLTSKKVPLKSAVQSGLVIAKQEGRGYYDRFRERIMFPIFNINEQVVGFGGRVMDDTLPKYINSPETELFNKRSSLYGLNRAKKACRANDSVFIVEGYFDVLSMHQVGIDHTVATLGTGLTQEHIRILKGFCRRFFLVYDSDEAGVKATERIVGNLVKENVEARVVPLPGGSDPDSFLLEKSPEEFMLLVTKSLGVVNFLIESAIRKYGLSAEGKIRIITDLEAPLTSIDDSVKRGVYIREIAERIDLDESSLLEKIRKAQERRGDGRIIQTKQQESTSDAFPIMEKEELRLEKKLVAMMLQFPTIIPQIKEKQLVEHFTDPMLQSIARLMFDYRGDPDRIVSEIIMSAGDKQAESVIAQLAVGDDSWNEKGGLKLIAQFQRRLFRQQKKPLINQIKAAEASNDPDLLEKLLKEKQAQSRNKELSSF